MSALPSDHPSQPRRPLDSALRLRNPARSLQSTGGRAGPLAQCPTQGPRGYLGDKRLPPRPTIWKQAPKGGGGLESGRPPPREKPPLQPFPPRPGPAPPEGIAHPEHPAKPLPPGPPPGTCLQTRSPTPGQRSRCPPPAGGPSLPSPVPPPCPTRHLPAPPPLGPLPNRPRRGLAQQRAHLRGTPSRPPPARSAVPAQAPTRSLRSPGGHPDPPAREAAAAAATAGERPAAATERAVRGVVAQRRALRDTESGRSSSACASARVGLQVPAGHGAGRSRGPQARRGARWDSESRFLRGSGLRLPAGRGAGPGPGGGATPAPRFGIGAHLRCILSPFYLSLPPPYLPPLHSPSSPLSTPLSSPLSTPRPSSYSSPSAPRLLSPPPWRACALLLLLVWQNLAGSTHRVLRGGKGQTCGAYTQCNIIQTEKGLSDT